MLLTSAPATFPVGEVLRSCRLRKKLSQLALACDAGISTRHLSFVETGRAMPSREMLLLLAEQMELSLREQNELLVSAGYAPVFPEKKLDHPAMGAVRQAVESVLKGHEPNPALAIDRHWNMVQSNRAVTVLLSGVAPWLLTPPVNVLRLGMHPDGLASRIVNREQWDSHLIARLEQQIAATGDRELSELREELLGYAPQRARSAPPVTANELAVPLCISVGAHVLSFFSATMLFGTPLDVTLSELAVETFFPMDSFTAEHMRTASSDITRPVEPLESRRDSAYESF